jgi:antitoxin HicB
MRPNKRYQYPAVFTPAEEGGYIITFPDVPEAITQGESIQECIKEAADALDEAIIGRINSGKVIPESSAAKSGNYIIPVPPQSAFKAALYEEIQRLNWSNLEVAAFFGVDEKEVRRLLDPHYSSKLPRIAELLERVGKRIVVSVQDENQQIA